MHDVSKREAFLTAATFIVIVVAVTILVNFFKA